MLDLNRMEVVIMSNLVKVMGNQVVVDSREVAKNFGRNIEMSCALLMG